MAAFSDYMQLAILNWTLRQTNFPNPAPTSVYIALFTQDPGEGASPAGELTGASGGYARLPISTNGGFTVPAGGTGPALCSNVNALEYAEATNDWEGPITHMAIFTAATSGNMLYHSPLNSPKTVVTGDVLRFTPGALQITVA